MARNITVKTGLPGFVAHPKKGTSGLPCGLAGRSNKKGAPGQGQGITSASRRLRSFGNEPTHTEEALNGVIHVLFGFIAFPKLSNNTPSICS